MGKGCIINKWGGGGRRFQTPSDRGVIDSTPPLMEGVIESTPPLIGGVVALRVDGNRGALQVQQALLVICNGKLHFPIFV